MGTQNALRWERAAKKLAVGGGLVALLCLLPALTRAQVAVQEWVQRYGGLGVDAATALAVDASGNVFVTGHMNRDYATIKYSGTGVPLWTNRYNGPGNAFDNATSLAVEGSGNVVVTGWSSSDGLTNSSSSGNDYATIKYSSAGVPLWTNRYNGPGNDSDTATAVTVDASGNAIVTGFSTGSGSNVDYATIKYSSAGVPLWTNRYNGSENGDDHAYALALDDTGNVFVTGRSLHPWNVTNYYVYATVAYSSAGQPLWTNFYRGPDWTVYSQPANGDNEAYALTVDSSSDVVVTGWSAGSNTSYYATIKYSGTGVALWTNRYMGPWPGWNVAYAVATDGSNNVFVTGRSWNGSTGDYGTVAYSSTGVQLWANLYNGPGNSTDYATAVAVDGNGNVIVTGSSYGAKSADSAEDYLTIMYSKVGVQLWENRYTGPGHGEDVAVAVAVDGSGNVFVTGQSNGTNSSHYWATIKYSNLRPVPLEMHRMDNQLVLSWTNAAFRLQCAPTVTGPFSNMDSVISPYTNPITGAQQFFRLISN